MATLSEDDKTFCRNLLMQVVTLNAQYNELLKILDNLELKLRQRFGGIVNIGNPEITHRIFLLHNLLAEKLNEENRK